MGPRVGEPHHRVRVEEKPLHLILVVVRDRHPEARLEAALDAEVEQVLDRGLSGHFRELEERALGEVRPPRRLAHHRPPERSPERGGGALAQPLPHRSAEAGVRVEALLPGRVGLGNGPEQPHRLEHEGRLQLVLELEGAGAHLGHHVVALGHQLGRPAELLVRVTVLEGDPREQSGPAHRAAGRFVERLELRNESARPTVACTTPPRPARRSSPARATISSVAAARLGTGLP